MTPVQCMVKHDPTNGTHGDCVRACVASLLDLPSHDVPHFFHDGCDGEIGHERLTAYLASINRTAFMVAYSGDMTLAEVLDAIGSINPHTPYMLHGCDASGGGHVVVCRGSKVVNDPAWYGGGLVGPTEQGAWVVMVIAGK